MAKWHSSVVRFKVNPLLTVEYSDTLLDDIDVPQEVFAVLQRSLSRDPEARHTNSAVLLSELDVVQAPRETTWIKREDVYFELSGNAFEKLAKEFPGKSRDEISSIIAGDLGPVCGVVPYQSIVPSSTERFLFYGNSFSLHVALHRVNPGQLVILSASRLKPGLAEQRREKALSLAINFRFGKPADQAVAQAAILNLRERLEKHQADLRESRLRQENKNCSGYGLLS